MPELRVPLPVQVVIDDVGWRQGYDGSECNQPFRTGMNRLHGPADYHAIADLGEALDIRPLAMLTLSEWDVANRLRRIPTASWMGGQWQNPAEPFDWCEPSAAVFRERAAFIEPGFHGLGHEFWIDGQMQRAEFCDREGNPRDDVEMIARFELFAELFDQHRFGEFPRWFVPTAFLHRYGPGSSGVLAEVARSFGIEAISTPFHRCTFEQPPEHPLLGFDHGLPTVDRGRDPLAWNCIGPDVAERDLPAQPIIGMHWPNLLAENPDCNGEVVRRWSRALGRLGGRFGCVLSENSDAFLEQLLAFCFLRPVVENRTVCLNLRELPPFGPGRKTNGCVLLHARGETAPLDIRAPGASVEVRRSETPAGVSAYRVDWRFENA